MQKCLSCSRVDSDIGLCGSTVTCPNAGRGVRPATDIVIHCEVCDITRCVPVGTLMKHQEPRLDNVCQAADCKAFIVKPPAAQTVYRVGDRVLIPGLNDEAPELTDEQIAAAEISKGGQIVKPATGTMANPNKPPRTPRKKA